jgi:drug/metabolite transporter (DMT)-like permease
MLRGMIIIITALMSIFFLKKKLFIHHWSSITCIFIGVVMVGLAAMLIHVEGESGDDSKTNPLGLLLLLLA